MNRYASLFFIIASLFIVSSIDLSVDASKKAKKERPAKVKKNKGPSIPTKEYTVTGILRKKTMTKKEKVVEMFILETEEYGEVRLRQPKVKAPKKKKKTDAESVNPSNTPGYNLNDHVDKEITIQVDGHVRLSVKKLKSIQ